MVRSAQEFATFLGMLHNPQRLQGIQQKTLGFMEQYQRSTQQTLAVLFGAQSEKRT